MVSSLVASLWRVLWVWRLPLAVWRAPRSLPRRLTLVRKAMSDRLPLSRLCLLSKRSTPGTSLRCVSCPNRYGVCGLCACLGLLLRLLPTTMCTTGLTRLPECVLCGTATGPSVEHSLFVGMNAQTLAARVCFSEADIECLLWVCDGILDDCGR